MNRSSKAAEVSTQFMHEAKKKKKKKEYNNNHDKGRLQTIVFGTIGIFNIYGPQL